MQVALIPLLLLHQAHSYYGSAQRSAAEVLQ
jgi:hypothetical protein